MPVALFIRELIAKKNCMAEACQTSSYVLSNNANLVVKSCLAGFFSSSAYKPNVLGAGGIGHSPSLAHAKKTYRRSEFPPAFLGRACFVACGRFSDERHMTAGKV